MVKLAHWKVDGCEFRHRALSVRPMSALGQKRTLPRSNGLSALPPKADIGSAHWDVRFVPKADITQSSKKAYSITSSAVI
jgi:hypothetical protein